MTRTVNKLTGKAQHQLNVFVEENYVKFGLHDPDFALKATEALGFKVTAGNIQGCREIFDIKGTRDLLRENGIPQGYTELKARVEALELALAAHVGQLAAKAHPAH